MPGQDGKGAENSEYSCTGVTESVTNLFNSEAIVEALTVNSVRERNVNSNVKHVQMSNNTRSSVLSRPPQLSQFSSSSPFSFSSSEFLSHLQIFSMETMGMSLSPIYLLFSLLTAVSCCCASNTLPSISSTSLPCSLRRCLVYARQRSVSIRNLSCKIGYICNLPLWTFHIEQSN